MNSKSLRKYWPLFFGTMACAFGVVSSELVAHKLSPHVRLTMISELQIEGPCLTSLIGPPTKSCIQWQPNVYAHPSFDPSRRLIFTGAGDHFLHVVDADTGKPFLQIETAGRVVTEPKFSEDRLTFYFGTDKGVVHGFDAYSFTSLFSFQADSKVHDNLTVFDGKIIFSSSFGSIYNLDGRSGKQNWRVEQPLASERLHLLQGSNIVVSPLSKGQKVPYVLVPHAEGYVLALDAQTGEIKKRFSLSEIKSKGFPDIVAPMVIVKSKLWVASYDLGLFSIDMASARVRDHLPLFQMTQLVTDGVTLFAASANFVLGIHESGKVLWKNDISNIKSRVPPLGFPFNRLQGGEKRMFFGSPSRLLISDRQLIMATGLGSIGVFDRGTGQLKQIVGNSVGFGPIDWVGPTSFMAVSKRGLLMKFQIGNASDAPF